jgi:peroxiredoxin 2/4
MAVLVGKPAPEFSTTAVVNGGDFQDNFTLSQFKGQKYVLLFFYPLDFSFVCPTEMTAFQDQLEEFEKRETVVIGCSTDSKYSHWAWLNTPRDQGGIQGVTYPILADLSKTIASNYGVLAGEYEYTEDNNGDVVLGFKGNPFAYRGLFLIDKNGIVQHQLVNNTQLGRSVDEAIRMVDALRLYQERGEFCPANWVEGKASMKTGREGMVEYLNAH